ncbi:MAG TPA: HAMP domain-containing sensor histidine kinase [Blastocatellia bacterium]|nr:HAMP domain-containing sensor histidine kinase [Blastocatellia bacterium]
MFEPMKLFISFRGRLMLLMTAFLLLTVVLVLGLDRWAQKRVSAEVRTQNERVKEIVGVSLGAFSESLSVALQNLNTEEYLYNRIAPGELPPDIKHIVVAEKDGKIADSTDRELLNKRILVPTRAVAQNQLGDPVGDESEFSGEQINTHYLPITTAKGLYWIVIVEQRQAVIDQIQDSSQRLAVQTRNLSRVRIAATTGLLSIALAVAVIVGWRFTQPIGELAEAARKVAAGQLDFHVGATRRDELGQLSFTFNEMIDGLKAKREIEERLHQTERAAVIGRMTQAIAHDIRNPLNVLKLTLGHFAAKMKPEAERAANQFSSLVATMKDEIGRLESRVNDLLDYSRPGPVSREVFDMRALLKESLSGVSAQAEEQTVEICVDQDDMPAFVLGDIRRLQSSISNIVVNAVQAMQGGGTLTTLMRRRDSFVEVTISDTGAGISEDHLSRIFEPYFSTKQTGFGLGLAVAKKVVEEHGGSISVDSRSGEGTTFTIKLPAADDEAFENEEEVSEKRTHTDSS